MYLARELYGKRIRYYIRHSWRDDAGVLRSRTLFDLGENPGKYIRYPGGGAFYVDPMVTERIASQELPLAEEDLEEVFRPFLDPDIRRRIDSFTSRRPSPLKGRLRAVDYEAIGHLSFFDKRRLYYLRFGHLSPASIRRIPAKFFRVLLNKSRDELEQYFLDLEEVLRPRELRLYVYLVFDLHCFFGGRFSQQAPWFLDQEKLDLVFLEEVCRLHDDPLFWKGFDRPDYLHYYLARYVVMFFDNDFAPRPPRDEYVRNFMHNRRQFRSPALWKSFSLDEASKLFGQPKEKLKSMGRRTLTRLYRQRAKELHPDLGGDHEDFVRLTDFYNALLRKK